MCGRMFPEESDQVEKYVGGLPDMIHGNVMSARPKTMQEAIELANDLMDQKVCNFAESQAENKRKLDNNPRDNQAQRQSFKRQNEARAYTARHEGRRIGFHFGKRKTPHPGGRATGFQFGMDFDET
ncbi:hypothetical protein Tco_0398992 [Tanacetum coccineum]